MLSFAKLRGCIYVLCSMAFSSSGGCACVLLSNPGLLNYTADASYGRYYDSVFLAKLLLGLAGFFS